MVICIVVESVEAFMFAAIRCPAATSTGSHTQGTRIMSTALPPTLPKTPLKRLSIMNRSTETPPTTMLIITLMPVVVSSFRHTSMPLIALHDGVISTVGPDTPPVPAVSTTPVVELRLLP